MRKTILCIALLIFFSTFAYAPLPVISNPSPTGELDYGTTGIILNVHTDVISTCKYSLVSGVAFSEMPFQFVTTDDTNHAVALGTENGVQYTYYIKCKYNNLGQETVDYPVSFSVSGVNPCNPNELICSGECTVPECTSNLDCPEIEGNQWVCISPLSCNSYCDSNSGCVPECTSNAECNDSNPNTTDVCQNLGSCEASCSNSSCVSLSNCCPCSVSCRIFSACCEMKFLKGSFLIVRIQCRTCVISLSSIISSSGVAFESCRSVAIIRSITGFIVIASSIPALFKSIIRLPRNANRS